MHQLCDGSKAGRTESTSQRPHIAALACKGIDQYGGNRLLDGIQKQSPTGKPRDSFSIHRLDERSQSHVNHFAPVAKFNPAVYSLMGGFQGTIGNPQEQTLLVAGSNPPFHTTREESHFSRLEGYSSHCGTLQAHLNEARPQYHRENMLILYLHVRLSGRRVHIYGYSHSLG